MIVALLTVDTDWQTDWLTDQLQEMLELLFVTKNQKKKYSYDPNLFIDWKFPQSQCEASQNTKIVRAGELWVSRLRVVGRDVHSNQYYHQYLVTSLKQV